MLEIPYRQFSHEVHDLKDSERIPLTGTFELTYRCNLRCIHCLTACSQFREKELKTREVFSIVDEIVKEGCLWMLLTGGEPLLREDFLDIYTYMKKRGLFITLFTNGTLITPKIADHLAKWRPFNIEITFHSTEKGIFEDISGVPGSFERCKRGIELLLERHIPLELKSVVMTPNKDGIRAIKEYAESIGVAYRFSAKLEPKIDGARDPLRFRIGPEEVVELDRSFKKHREAYRERCKDLARRDSDRLYNCAAGFSSFHVNPYGRLLPCDMLSNFSYDLRQGPFTAGWRDLNSKVRKRRSSKNFKCRGCKVFGICEACPGLFLRENGGEEEISEFYCEVARRRFETFKGGEVYEETV